MIKYIVACILTVMLSGCHILFKKITAESRTSAIERSLRDSVVALNSDTVYSVGSPIYLYESFGLEDYRVDVKRLDAAPLLRIDRVFTWGRGDTVEYRISSASMPDTVMIRVSPAGYDNVISTLMRRLILLRDRVDGAAASRLLASGVFRTYDSAYRAYKSRYPDPVRTSGAGANARFAVALKNECSRTVKFFVGEKPGYSSGTFDSIGGNTYLGSAVYPGDRIWIVDDKRNPINNIVVFQGTKTIYIEKDGKTFRQE